MKVRSKVKDFRAVLQKDRKVDIWCKLNDKLTHIFSVVKLAKPSLIKKQFYKLTWKEDYDVLIANKFIQPHDCITRKLDNKKEYTDELSEVMSCINFAKAFWLDIKTIDTLPPIKKLIGGVKTNIPLDVNIVKVKDALSNVDEVEAWIPRDYVLVLHNVFKVLELKYRVDEPFNPFNGCVFWEYMGVKLIFDTSEVTWLGLGKVHIPKSRIAGVYGMKSNYILDIARGFRNCNNWLESDIFCWISAVNIYNEINDIEANYKLKVKKAFDYWDYPLLKFNRDSNEEELEDFISLLKDNVSIIEIREQLKELGYKKVVVGYYNNIDLFTMDVETGDIKYSKVKSLDRASAHLKVYTHAQDTKEYFINKQIDNSIRFCYQLNI